MSTKEQAERLAQALTSLQYVEPVSFEGSEYGTIKALCRIKTEHLADWALVVTEILKTSEALEYAEQGWDSHICRLYMLRDGKLVYGWLVAITSQDMEETLSHLIPVIKKGALPPPAPVAVPTQTKPIIRRPTPDADAKGNPRVPPHHMVTEVPMAGLHPDMDRNAPSERTLGKGGYGMFSSKNLGSVFKPGK